MTFEDDQTRRERNRAVVDKYLHSGHGDALLRRHEAYNAQCEDVARLEAEGRVFVIRPESPLGIGRMERDPARLQEVYDRGAGDGKRTLPAVRAYLA